MKILFGIQTTGNGHVCRSREILKYLKAMGHDVHVLFSGKDSSRMKHDVGFKPSRICHGLTFQTRNGHLQIGNTLLHLKLFGFYHEIAGLSPIGYDLIITDFEPITARLAKRFSIPSIGIGHQYAFYQDIPMKGRIFPSLWILKQFAFCDYPVGLHWHHFGFSILPPIVPPELQRISNVIRNKIVVYLPFENSHEIETTFSAIDSHRFFIYGIADVIRAYNQGNLSFRPFSREGILRDLQECSGVICNAGFELVSEALHIGKKVLVKPLKGQMEQESNALALHRLKLGEVMEGLDPVSTIGWLKRPGIPPMGYPSVAPMIAEWIDKRNWKDINPLVREAWSQTKEIGRRPS